MNIKYTQECPCCGGVLVAWDKTPDGWTYCENGHVFKVQVCRVRYTELLPTHRIGYALAGWQIVQKVGHQRWNTEIIGYIPVMDWESE